MTPQALGEALNANVKSALGAMQFQIIALETELAALRAAHAALLQAQASVASAPEAPG